VTALMLHQVQRNKCSFINESATFISKNPWLIHSYISIEVVDLAQINKSVVSLWLYHFGGCLANFGEHFGAIVIWHGRLYLYV